MITLVFSQLGLPPQPCSAWWLSSFHLLTDLTTDRHPNTGSFIFRVLSLPSTIFSTPIPCCLARPELPPEGLSPSSQPCQGATHRGELYPSTGLPNTFLIPLSKTGLAQQKSEVTKDSNESCLNNCLCPKENLGLYDHFNCNPRETQSFLREHNPKTQRPCSELPVCVTPFSCKPLRSLPPVRCCAV